MVGKEVRVGIVGAGFIAQQSHIPAYLNNPRSKIVGVADPDTRRLDEVRKHFGIQEVFTDYQELFEENFDAISICVPTNLHAKIIMNPTYPAFPSHLQHLCNNSSIIRPKVFFPTSFCMSKEHGETRVKILPGMFGVN